MLCQICGKIAATVHLTEIANNKINEMHLCEECAHKKGLGGSPFEISDLLSGLAETGEGLAEERAEVKCSSCGLTYDDFKKIGRLGCAVCYEAFKSQLTPLLKKIHGANIHIGKSPVKTQGKRKSKSKSKKSPPLTSTLKGKLAAAIAAEAFEEAAQLRDQIRELEKNKK